MKCDECGARLEAETNECPLCGHVTGTEPAPPKDVEDYQSHVRELREQLKKLRDDHAEAV